MGKRGGAASRRDTDRDGARRPLLCNVVRLLDDLECGQSVGVVTLSGALSPVHRMHAECLRRAIDLVRPRHATVVGFLAPSSESYVNSKLGPGAALPLERRVHCCTLVAEESADLGVCPRGEASSRRVCKTTVGHLQEAYPHLTFRGYEVAGADYALKAHLWRRASESEGIVCFGRAGHSEDLQEALARECGPRGNPDFILGPILEDISSTQVRQLLAPAGPASECAAERRLQLEKMLHPSVLRCLVADGAGACSDAGVATSAPPEDEPFAGGGSAPLLEVAMESGPFIRRLGCTLKSLPLLATGAAVGCRLSKKHFQQIAEETVAWCEQGGYTNSNGKWVPLPIADAVASTRLHPDVGAVTAQEPRRGAADARAGCVVSVVQATTLCAAEALVRQGLRTALLNFASAKNPGGGFLRGANAQEESLARVSGLYPCLLKAEVQPYYTENARERSCVYTDNMIMSDAVPIFRGGDGSPLDSPYTVGVLTAPAPNLGEAMSRPEAGGVEAIKAARRRRMSKAMHLLADGGFDAVVLGAWGCGVFKNDPAEVADEFCELLGTTFRGAFSHVVFAVVDAPTCAVFQAACAGTQVPQPGHGGRTPELDGRHSRRWGKHEAQGGRKNASWAKRNLG